MNIQLTERAANRIRSYLEQESAARGQPVGLRIGVKRSGCSGYSYTVDYATDTGPDDQIHVDRGVRVIVERQYLPMLDGIVVDYVREGLNQKFVFTNPNAGESCGCGESFSLKA
jgi:iron-sulfur cluster assembly protein